MWKFPQEEWILCVNYSHLIKIHVAHLPEMAEKKDVEYLIVCINTALNGILWWWGLFLDYTPSCCLLIVEFHFGSVVMRRWFDARLLKNELSWLSWIKLLLNWHTQIVTKLTTVYGKFVIIYVYHIYYLVAAKSLEKNIVLLEYKAKVLSVVLVLTE